MATTNVSAPSLPRNRAGKQHATHTADGDIHIFSCPMEKTWCQFGVAFDPDDPALFNAQVKVEISWDGIRYLPATTPAELNEDYAHPSAIRTPKKIKVTTNIFADTGATQVWLIYFNEGDHFTG